MNPKLPKEGSLDGVLSRNPDPPAMNAGMPRDPGMLDRLKAMQMREQLMEMGPRKVQQLLGLNHEGDYRHLFDESNPDAFRHGIQDAGRDEIVQLARELETQRLRREQDMRVGGASAPNPSIPDEIKYGPDDCCDWKGGDPNCPTCGHMSSGDFMVHRKSADIAFSMLKRDIPEYVDSTDGPVEMCPECAEPMGDGSCSECLDQQRHEGRYVELWGADQHEIGPIECQYRSVPEDHPEGEYTWDCPYCKTENQEWSGAQSVMSPFRFSSEADVQCVGCGEEVPIAEPKTIGKSADPRLEEWLNNYFSGEEEPARTDLPYPQWKEQVMNQMYGLDTDDPITTAHDWDEEEAMGQHWLQSDSCDCNMSNADKREYLQEMMMEALEDDPNADLEEIYGGLMEEMAFSAGGQGRSKKWMKSKGRCGHCGGQSEMDEEGRWRQTL